MVTVVLATANSYLGSAAKASLARTSDIQVVGAGRDVEAVISAVSQREPRLLIVDLALPQAETLTRLTQLWKGGTQGPRVLTIDNGSDERRALAMAKAGAYGYMSAKAIPIHLSRAIRKITAGEAWFSRKLMGRIVDELHRRSWGLGAMDRCVADNGESHS